MDGRDISSRAQVQLPSALQVHVLSFLPPNDRALSGRLACRDAADGFSGPQHCTASLSQPLPPHALPWAVETGQQHVRQVSFERKFRLLSTAAASSSEVNLEVALALLQPSIFPEMLHNHEGTYKRQEYCEDPGVAAVEAGHPQLLGWLLHHCPALVHPTKALEAAATHCDLAGLQAVWQALQGQRDYWRRGRNPEPCKDTLDAAARSHTPDALDKVRWLLETGSGRLGARVTEAAIRSGDLGRLRWLRERGCVFGGHDQLSVALRHADLAVLQWLVDEAGCDVAEAGCECDSGWQLLLMEAAGSRRPDDGVAKLRWLQERGARQLDTEDGQLLRAVVHAAIAAGQVELVQQLLSVHGPCKVLADPINVQAFLGQSGSLPMAQCLHQAGAAFDHLASLPGCVAQWQCGFDSVAGM